MLTLTFMAAAGEDMMPWAAGLSSHPATWRKIVVMPKTIVVMTATAMTTMCGMEKHKTSVYHE